jgi:Bacterial protein of unknown function (DUF899)
MGWSFPWASSSGSDFSYDFQAASTPEQQQSGTGEYNFRPRDMRPSLEAGKEGPLAEWAASCGTDWPTYAREAPGISTFALEDGVVYHTYSAYARAGWTACGACTSGWTGHREDETRRVPPTPPQLVPPPRRVRQPVTGDRGDAKEQAIMKGEPKNAEVAGIRRRRHAGDARARRPGHLPGRTGRPAPSGESAHSRKGCDRGSRRRLPMAGVDPAGPPGFRASRGLPPVTSDSKCRCPAGRI